jgi:CDP-diacylglycerol--glycerol-3-phosphate 3-phosphatidyltransferase
MRRTSTLLAPLRACPHATAGPSRLPAVRIPSGRWRASSPVLARWTSSASSSSSSPGRPDGAGSPHSHPAFEALSSALSASQPCFGARGDEIELLTSPEQFKATLLAMIKRAKRRILISSLYIGAGQSELVSTETSSPRRRASMLIRLSWTFYGQRSRPTPTSEPRLSWTITEGLGSRLRRTSPRPRPICSSR